MQVAPLWPCSKVPPKNAEKQGLRVARILELDFHIDASFLEISQTPNFSRGIPGSPLFPPPPLPLHPPLTLFLPVLSPSVFAQPRQKSFLRHGALQGTKRNTAGNGFSNATFPLRVYAVTSTRY